MDYDDNKPRISKLTGVNYRTWEIQVSRLLKAQGLYGAINGKFAQVLKNAVANKTAQDSAASDGNDDATTETMVLDAKASTLIMGFCSQRPLDHIISLELAQEQWDKLRALYAPLGLQQLDTKTQGFINYIPRQNATIASISTELDTLQSEIEVISADERPSDTMKLTILYRAVRSLDTMYDPIVLQLGLAKVTNYEEVVVQLMEYERRITANGKTIKENVFSATTNQKNMGRKKEFKGKCFNCGKVGHRKANCRQLQRDNSNMASTGPLATPNGGRGLSPGDNHKTYYTSETSWMTLTTEVDAVGNDHQTWVIDSACSRHMTYSRDVFDNYHLLQTPSTVRVANGTSIQAIGEGSVRLKVAIHGIVRSVLLHQVLHVPGLAGSLISVSQLQDRGILIRTTANGELILELNGKVVGRAVRIKKTYILASTLEMSDVAYYTTAEENNMVWHRRFGHLGATSLKKVHETTIGLDRPIGSLAEACESCIKNKMTRVINRQSPERALRVLGRIYTDAWGPYRVPSLAGDTYFFTFTDDYSRKSWVYTTNSRAKLREIFTEFKVQVELETSAKIQIVRCDNISEYKALAIMFGKNYGIQFEFTTTYTPEQNGVSERLNRSLVTAARTMLSDAKLPARFWADAVKTACYLRNRTPIGPDGKTPEEAYSGKRPSIEHLRAWGCVAYAHLAPINRGRNDKMHPVAIRTCLIGYMPTSRQYRLYDPVKKAILVSTAPRFIEDKRLDVRWDDLVPNFEAAPFEPTEAEFDVPALMNDGSREIRGEEKTPVAPNDDDNNSDQQLQREVAQIPLNESTGEHTLEQPLPMKRQYKKAPREKKWTTFLKEPFKDFQPEVIEGRTRRSGTRLSERLQQNEAPSQVVDSNQHEDNADERRELPDGDDMSSERAYLANVDTIHLPISYQEAIHDPMHGPEWESAIRAELVMLQSLGTWEYAELPADKRAVGHKWVFTVKYTTTGQIDRFKARLTAQGFSQVSGENFLETFSPTMRAESMRVLLAIAAHEDLEVRQVDVISAYPRSKLHAEVYMKPPDGLECPPGKVLRLNTSLYGLKQSGREWYIEACHGLLNIGLRPTASDPSVFKNEDRSLILGLYVDDMLIISKDIDLIKRTISLIKKLWDIKDIGNVKEILGLCVQRDRNQRTITICQTSYIERTLREFNLLNTRPASLPASDRNMLVAASPDESQTDQALYQQAIGRLMWIANSTRFDISYVVGQLSQHCNKPVVRHWNSVLQVLRYLSGTRDLKLRIGGKGQEEVFDDRSRMFGYKLHGFSDADYAGDHLDRRSVTGHLYLLSRGLVSWSSSKQKCVATSTTEAEYIALSEASKQGQWIRALLKELKRFNLLEDNQAVPMHSDNQACIALSQDPVGHRRTKHIDVRYHYIRELVSYRKATVEYLPSEDMIADILTKPLPAAGFKRCINGLLVS